MKKTLAYIFPVLLLIILGSCKGQKNLAKQHHADLKDVYQTLKTDMPEALVTMDGEKVKVVLPESVLFAVNSAELKKEYLPILAKMAGILNKYTRTSILISGYTDISGTEAYNLDLSKKRAESARKVFLQHKVASARMFTWGRGAKSPVADNSTELGRQQNRRVEYVILYDYKAEQ